ncbi:MAG: hypothetical protein IKQ31_01410 [Clostridia bacterium]|nr:hypothetical protein [Clostridia bacterium]
MQTKYNNIVLIGIMALVLMFGGMLLGGISTPVRADTTSCTLSFYLEAEGGEDIAPVMQQTVEIGEPTTLPTTVSGIPEGDLKGWSSGSTTYELGASITPSENMSFYAVWQEKLSATYTYNGGKVVLGEILNSEYIRLTFRDGNKNEQPIAATNERVTYSMNSNSFNPFFNESFTEDMVSDTPINITVTYHYDDSDNSKIVEATMEVKVIKVDSLFAEYRNRNIAKDVEVYLGDAIYANFIHLTIIYSDGTTQGVSRYKWTWNTGSDTSYEVQYFVGTGEDEEEISISSANPYVFNTVEDVIIYIKCKDALGNDVLGELEIEVNPVFSITYDANGGSGSMASFNKTDAHGIYRLISCGFTAPEGKRFDKWSIKFGNSDEEVEFAPGRDIYVNDNVEIKPKWTDDVYVENFSFEQVEYTTNIFHPAYIVNREVTVNYGDWKFEFDNNAVKTIGLHSYVEFLFDVTNYQSKDESGKTQSNSLKKVITINVNDFIDEEIRLPIDEVNEGTIVATIPLDFEIPAGKVLKVYSTDVFGNTVDTKATVVDNKMVFNMTKFTDYLVMLEDEPTSNGVVWIIVGVGAGIVIVGLVIYFAFIRRKKAN